MTSNASRTHIIEEGNKDSQHGNTQNPTTDTRPDPRKRRITRPPKHKERNHKQRRRHQAKLDPHLGRCRIRCISLGGLLVPRVEVDEVDDGRDDAAEEDAEEHEAGDTGGETVADAEDDRVGFKHEVDARGGRCEQKGRADRSDSNAPSVDERPERGVALSDTIHRMMAEPKAYMYTVMAANMGSVKSILNGLTNRSFERDLRFRSFLSTAWSPHMSAIFDRPSLNRSDSQGAQYRSSPVSLRNLFAFCARIFGVYVSGTVNSTNRPQKPANMVKTQKSHLQLALLLPMKPPTIGLEKEARSAKLLEQNAFSPTPRQVPVTLAHVQSVG